MQNSKFYRNIPFTYSSIKLHAPTKLIWLQKTSICHLVHNCQVWPATVKFKYLHSLLIFCWKKISVQFVYCAALWDRLEGVTSFVNQPFDWQLLSAEKFLQYFLSKFRRARVCKVFDCLQSFLDGSWKASLYSKKKWRFPLLFSTLSTYSNYLKKINRKKHYIIF